MSFDIMGAQQWEMNTPRQTFRKFPKINFYFVNRKEYLEGNPFLRWYFDQPNIKCGIYADLQRWITGYRDDIRWRKL